MVCYSYFFHLYSYWFFTILLFLSLLQTRIQSRHHETLSMKTNTSCVNLMLHYVARRQWVRYKDSWIWNKQSISWNVENRSIGSVQGNETDAVNYLQALIYRAKEKKSLPFLNSFFRYTCINTISARVVVEIILMQNG